MADHTTYDRTAEETPPAADVYIGAREAPGTESDVVAALAALGFTVRVKVWPVRRAVAELHWLLLVALPLHSFLGGLGSRLSDDLYRKLKETVRRRPEPASAAEEPRLIVLQDTDTGVRLLLGPESDAAALAGLRDLDLTRFRHTTLRYDPDAARWAPVPGAEEDHTDA
ncbi:MULTISPECIES: hypothetical protein [Streptomyces]|uniref:Uncharacterized protein n=1 Tax=Streptomyces sp. NBC_00093 TaxID=2975649 RepID=A0AAU1ZY46_9ACTN